MVNNGKCEYGKVTCYFSCRNKVTQWNDQAAGFKVFFHIMHSKVVYVGAKVYVSSKYD